MGPLFALASAGMAGSADYWGARASRRAPPLVVVAAGHLVGAFIMLAIVFGRSFPVSDRTIVLGLASGVMIVVAQLFLYAGYRGSDVGLVGPSAAAIGVAVPVLYGLAVGERPTSQVALGLTLGMAGIIQLSRSESGEGRSVSTHASGRGVACASGSGVSFGILFIMFSHIEWSAAVPAMVMNRLAALVLAAVVAGRKWQPIGALYSARWLVLGVRSARDPGEPELHPLAGTRAADGFGTARFHVSDPVPLV